MNIKKTHQSNLDKDRKAKRRNRRKKEETKLIKNEGRQEQKNQKRGSTATIWKMAKKKTCEVDKSRATETHMKPAKNTD